MRLLFITILTTRLLMKRLLTVRPFPKRSAIKGLPPTRFTGWFFLMVPLASPLDYALIILEIRISNPFSLANFVLLFFLAPFLVFFFLLIALGLSCNEPGIEILILLLEDLHRFCHGLQEVHQLWVVRPSRNARKGVAPGASPNVMSMYSPCWILDE